MRLIEHVRNRGWQIRDGMQRRAYLKRVVRENASFDRRFGTDTAGFKPREEYDLPDDQRQSIVPYEPVNETGFRMVIDCALPEAEGHTFVDIGSGKGKALLMAATYRFREVIGVELDEPLHEIALENIETARRREPFECPNVSSVKMEAQRFDGYSDRNFVFVFNPFGAEVMDEFVHHLSSLIRERDLSILLAYLNPRHAEFFDESDVFEERLRTGRLSLYGTKDMTIDPDNAQRLKDHFSGWN